MGSASVGFCAQDATADEIFHPPVYPELDVELTIYAEP